mmetsp:Transcript_21726/g.44600  ORF Transcript_21726/g.44600 Transcript_21726/m.44600 type:complete len:252 (+) Transcript_21726:123-878(+)
MGCFSCVSSSSRCQLPKLMSTRGDARWKRPSLHFVHVGGDRGGDAVLDGGARLRVYHRAHVYARSELLGPESDADGEKRVAVPLLHIELEAGRLVGAVDHLDLPHQLLRLVVVAVRAGAAVHDLGRGRGAERNRDEHVVELDARFLARVLHIHVHVRAVGLRPAVDGDGHLVFRGGRHGPPQDPHRFAFGEPFGGVFERKLPVLLVQLLVHFRVRLEREPRAFGTPELHLAAQGRVLVGRELHRAFHLEAL